MKIVTENGEEALFASYAGSQFNIKDTKGNLRAVYKPILQLTEIADDPTEYEYYILCNNREDYGENDIHQVMIQNNGKGYRIGWIFPIQALESTLHEHANNSHFLRYAFVALCYLLNREEEKINEDFQEEELLLRDIFTMKETILVIDKGNISAVPGFDLKDYVISLYAHGYSFSGEGNLWDSCEDVQEKQLHLKPISIWLKNKTYISTLFQELIPSAKEPISQFYLCYQIVEILITSVFECEIRKMVKEMEQTVIGDDVIQYKEKLDRAINEKNRVKRLFNGYASYSTELKERLKNKCDEFLLCHGECIPGTVAESLYSVRCFLVHRCFLLENDDNERISAINDPFYGIAIQMLLSFRDNNDHMDD